MRIPTLAVLALALVFAACGSDQPATTPAGDRATTAEAPGAHDEVVDGVRTITITPVGNEMRFEQTEISATAGETLRIVFNNTASSPAMSHNVLFVTDASEINAVGQAAMDAADRDYIPDHPAVIASTPMAAPGERVEMTFTVPEEPGDYPYICTFPGHYMMMQGTMRVTAS
jgi:azurin